MAPLAQVHAHMWTPALRQGAACSVGGTPVGFLLVPDDLLGLGPSPGMAPPAWVREVHRAGCPLRGRAPMGPTMGASWHS
jgi:hypothetical protein